MLTGDDTLEEARIANAAAYISLKALRMCTLELKESVKKKRSCLTQVNGNGYRKL